MAISTALMLCLVVGVSDGDTLKARCGEPGAYEQISVRLGEIDAPEKEQPFGAASKKKLSDLCFSTNAEIKPMLHDRYGRLVARVRCKDQDASEFMVRSGYAWFFTRYGKDMAVQRLEAAARKGRLGLWAEPQPVPPWEWRRERRSGGSRSR